MEKHLQLLLTERSKQAAFLSLWGKIKPSEKIPTSRNPQPGCLDYRRALREPKEKSRRCFWIGPHYAAHKAPVLRRNAQLHTFDQANLQIDQIAWRTPPDNCKNIKQLPQES